MKDDPQGKPCSGAHRAYAVAVSDTVRAAAALDGTLVDRENDRVPTLQRDNFRPALPARALLGEDELAAAEAASIRQEYRHLKRKGVLAVKVLVEAIIVSRLIFED